MPGVGAAGAVLDGKYVLHAALGSGRFGTVYRATHVALQKPVAVKVLRTGGAAAARDFERFRVEAEALGRLDHPHIVRVTDFGVDPSDAGLPYLVMELVEGRPLDALVPASGLSSVRTVSSWLAQIASAIDHAHAAGVAHGDLSGRNVLVIGSGDTAVLKVIDFGLAQLALAPGDVPPSEQTPVARLGLRFTGTPECAAPERLRGEPPSSAADVYALAALAYRLATGRYPFEGAPRDVSQARLTRSAPAPSSLRDGLPPEFDAAVLRGLAASATARPRCAAELSDACAEAERLGRRREWRRREGPRRVAVATGLSILLAAAAPWFATSTPVQRLEGLTEDVRFALSSPRTPDPRVLLVAIDDAALAADPTPLPRQGGTIATVLSAALDAGAAAAAFDLLLPREWAAEAAFGDLLTRGADRVVLAVAPDARDAVVGTEAVDPLVAAALGPEAASRLFALVTHAVGPDGVVRRSHAARLDVDGAPRATLAGAVAGRLVGAASSRLTEPVVVDYRVEARALPRVGWQEFVRQVRDGSRLDGRAVIVGADFTGSGDRHRVPGPRRLTMDVSGLALQGLVVNTLIAGGRLREASTLTSGAAAAVSAFTAAMVVLWFRRWRQVAVLLTAALAAGAAAVAIGWTGGIVVPVAVPLATGLLAGGFAVAVRRQWAMAPE